MTRSLIFGLVALTATTSLAVDTAVPGRHNTDRIAVGAGELAQMNAYLDATILAITDRLEAPRFSSEKEVAYALHPVKKLDTWAASCRLATIQGNDRHKSVLVAVAIRWQACGLENPIAKAMEFQNFGYIVSPVELEQLYRQVLTEQGMLPGDGDTGVWSLLEGAPDRLDK